MGLILLACEAELFTGQLFILDSSLNRIKYYIRIFNDKMKPLLYQVILQDFSGWSAYSSNVRGCKKIDVCIAF